MASASPASSGISACARPRAGRAPGVAQTAPHPSGRAAITPARTNEVLPVPEGPMTASSRRLRSRCQRAATSASRPKNCAASFSVKLESPGYGLRSSTSWRLAAPAGAARTASSATATSCADG